MSSPSRPSPPHRRIVAELRARILAGDLRPGDRLLSTRQIAQRWGVGGGGGGPGGGGGGAAPRAGGGGGWR
ncbi:GntR family transcriptional regulator, partial [Saccharothrix sp. NEAU-S10]|nr:GntR family transcriptional regulator [Saccharothrix luteola]